MNQSLPDYWLPQPPMQLSEDEQRACDELLRAAIAMGPARPIDYRLTLPKWQFLCYLATHHKLALHGSDNGEIARFEPRQSSDMNDFGAQNAIYAAADGIWPMYFAVVDRVKSPTISNACVAIEQADGTFGTPYYFFSISKKAVGNQPYRAGTVYILPRASFVRQPIIEFGALRIDIAQLASQEAVTPLAKLPVAPEDFPFLAQMRAHDDDNLAAHAEALGRGLPLPD